MASSAIPTTNHTYSFTGREESILTEEEIQLFDTKIDRAKHIEQIENRLILSGTKGKQIDYCSLQKYASKIKTDCVLSEEIALDALVENNLKMGEAHFYKVGYMPGEIYSFGIVYIFSDGTHSPVYHIPGKNIKTKDITFTEGSFPMSIDNTCSTKTYTDRSSSCSSEGYWGLDSEGESLLNSKVRHHRFPTRPELNIPLFDRQNTTSSNAQFYDYSLHIRGEISTEYTAEAILLRIEFIVEGVTKVLEKNITVATYNPDTGLDIDIISTTSNIDLDSFSFTEIKLNGQIDTNPSGLIYQDLPEYTEEDKAGITKK